MSTVLAIAAHPDDEVIGCGGTLARHSRQGDNVCILILADGVSSRGDDPAQLQRRRQAAEKAAIELGARDLKLLDFPDNRLDQLPLLEIVQAIELVLREVNPDIVYTHHAGDLNIDHVLVHRAVVTACRPLVPVNIQLIAAFEVLSSTEWTSPSQNNVFVPRLFVNIADTFNCKVAALRCYSEEMREYPHPRSEQSLTALAAYRGVMAGFEMAEAFEIIRLRHP